MDADVVCLNEVEDDETFALDEVAGRAGYPFVFQGDVSTSMAGGLTNACLSRRPFDFATSHRANEISPDPDANDMGRDFTEVRVPLLPGISSITIVSAHFKAGFTNADHVRRQIEATRLSQLVDILASERPNDPILAVGDFNEDIEDNVGQVFSSPPSDLPVSFELGSDLGFPLT